MSTTPTSAFGLDALLHKVQSCLARADHPNTPPAEAQASREMAERLMEKYRIDEAQLGDAGKLKGYEPIWRVVDLCSYRSEFRNHYHQMMSAIARHLDVRAMFEVISSSDGMTTRFVANVCGYESDLRFAELLITQASLTFGKRLEPVYDPELSDQMNAYLMRMAGMEGKRIAMAMWGKCGKSDPPKVRAMFKKEAEARGEDPTVLLGQGNSVKLYRQSYAEGFVGELWHRLRVMANARMMDGGLVMVGRKEAVNEAFYTRYPAYRPAPPSAVPIGQDRHEECPKCKRAKGGYCREHDYRRPGRYKEPKVNFGAYYQGQAAAREVNLERG